MIVIVGFIIGTILGSLVKALASRSLTKHTFWGRSFCPHCKETLRWYDLLPVISYIQLQGKCRYCKKKIDLEYLLVEIALGVLIALIFFQYFQYFPPFSDYFRLSFFMAGLLFQIFFITVLSVLFLTDLKKMFIPDRIILPSIVISLIYIVAINLFQVIYLYISLARDPLGQYLLPPQNDYFTRHAIYLLEPFFLSILMGFLIALFFIILIIITKGRGMGGGDVKLGAFIGFSLGFPNSVLALLLSFLSGAIVSIILMIFGRKSLGQSIPFGPFLVFGSLISLFWGTKIISWYLSLAY